jgi:hypothetical protein
MRDDLEQDLASTRAFRTAKENYTTTYNHLNQPMRMFTKTFWLALMRTRFEEGDTNLSYDGTVGVRVWTDYMDSLVKLYDIDPLNGIRRISMAELEAKIAAVNRIICVRSVLQSDKGKERAYVPLISPTMKQKSPSAGQGGADTALRGNGDRPGPPMTSRESDEHGPAFLDDESPHKRRKTVDFEISPHDDVQQSTDILRSTVPNSPQHGQATTDRYQQIFGQEAGPSTVREKRTATITTPESNTSTLPVRSRQGKSVMNPGGVYAAKADQNTEPTSETQPSVWNPYAQDTTRSNYGNPQPLQPEGSGSTSTYQAIDPSSDWDTTLTQPNTTLQQQPQPFSTQQINPYLLLTHATTALSNLSNSILYPPHLFHATTDLLPTNLFDTLQTLSDAEFKYLPLWAGGNDDGSGGVFEDPPVPMYGSLDERYEGLGFAPGAIRKGHDAPSTAATATANANATADSDVTSMSSFEEIGTSQGVSTVGRASRLATDGTRTETVVSLDNESVASTSTTGEAVVLMRGVDLASGSEVGRASGRIVGHGGGNEDFDMGGGSDSDSDADTETGMGMDLELELESDGSEGPDNDDDEHHDFETDDDSNGRASTVDNGKDKDKVREVSSTASTPKKSTSHSAMPTSDDGEHEDEQDQVRDFHTEQLEWDMMSDSDTDTDT